VSRVTDIDGPPGEPRVMASMTAEYDVPPEAWFFDAGSSAAMPVAALVEVALQPCGVLAAYQGSALRSEMDLYFRNLDGDLVISGHVRPGVKILSTRVEVLSSASFAGNIIQSFAIECRADGVPIVVGTAAFGFFSLGALAGQVGLPPTGAEALVFDAPSDVTVELRDRPARFFGGPLRLPGPMLLMLDRITGFWPDGGEAGLGRLRAERDIDSADWYFKAHFYGDPVQPGSLGVDAMCQLLQFFCIETGLGAGVPDPVFEPAMSGARAVWKFRGQVLPTDGTITIEAEIREVGEDYVRAQAWLWVDGRRIYHAPELAIRIVTAHPGERTTPAIVDRVLDPSVEAWIGDHRPGWTTPVLPMMSTVDLLADAAFGLAGSDVTGLSDVQLRQWLPVTGPTRLRTRAQRAGESVDVVLQKWREAGRLSRFEVIAAGTAHLGAAPPPPEPLPPLTDARPVPDVYESGELFHGRAFHYLTDLRSGSTGSTGIIDAGAGFVPRGYLHQGLLDAITHVVPHASMWQWDDGIARDRVAFPHRISALAIFEPLPTAGALRVEARFGAYDGDDRRLPAVNLQVWRDERIVLALRLVEVLLPIGALARVTPRRRRAFLRDHAYVEEFVPAAAGGTTTVSADDLVAFAWLTGSLASVYGLPPGARIEDHLGWIAVATHVGHIAKVHPRRVVVTSDLSSAWVEDRPDVVHRVSVITQGGRVTVANP
jgi:3-hydroxymyristoyl/3-hydroxydecanoyl-(acyl carrier protein) dehydratase